ncbi:putative nucleotidyltransferase-like protein [Ruminiclostridium sufflavum DSM 19573]|uniref:Putative nucleotidyltransferase-like protein n=1 Tax=Ruminiclostridium sufflavum DSM 19573 TaxID=1121337 RepID=A0A318XNC8_9FIRM|nr:nucleotidyltransferase family protein [Ruminiclostridium sufflavum]PYG88226.1 putative nucleotidyltransferase-like protein [Ruminiclostridium sufflavum DSM 19573]
MKRDELSAERQLVLMTAIEMEEAQGAILEEILSSHLNWADIIFQMITHRTIGMFYYNLKKFKLVDKLEKEISRLLDAHWQVYGERNGHYQKELAEVLKAFNEHNVVVPILKGNLLASIVYPELETRIFNDLDMIMKLDDVVPVTQALEGIGFIQGHFDEEKQEIIPASRKEKMLQQMVSHELQEFQKLSGNKFAKLVQVDINHDILWKGNCPYKVPTAELIARALPITISGVQGYMLDYIDNIIQLSCHLYKEATLMMWVTDLRDLKIYKFSDLFMYIKKFFGKIDWELLIERVKGYNLDKVVYYNFHYIEMMFGKLIPEKVMEAIRPSDLTYLDEYGIENKEPSIWEYDFFTRLFETDRVLTLAENQVSGMKKYLDAKAKSDGVFKHRILDK